MMPNVTANDQTMATPLARTCSPSRLEPAAVEQALLEAEVEEVRVGEEADQQRADEAADEVHADDVEGVVVAGLELDLDGVAADDAGDGADEDAATAPDTKPAPGVIATRPATMPEAAPRLVACPSRIHSTSTHTSPAAAAARNVFMNAWAA